MLPTVRESAAVEPETQEFNIKAAYSMAEDSELDARAAYQGKTLVPTITELQLA